MRHLILSSLLLAAAPVAAQETIATDRPDFVESSLTVGRGVFQLETSGAFDRADDVRTIGTPTLFRFGVSKTLELRLETDGYQHASIDGVDAEHGMADAALGLKWHALDGAGRRPSVAFLLHGDLPSGSEVFRTDGVRPSLRVVGEWELPADFSLGVMPGIVYDVDGLGDREWVALLGATVGKPVSERLRFFVEYTGERFPLAQSVATVQVFDFGSAFLISDDIQLDLSMAFGLTEGASDHGVAIGFSRRFK